MGGKQRGEFDEDTGEFPDSISTKHTTSTSDNSVTYHHRSLDILSQEWTHQKSLDGANNVLEFDSKQDIDIRNEIEKVTDLKSNACFYNISRNVKQFSLNLKCNGLEAKDGKKKVIKHEKEKEKEEKEKENQYEKKDAKMTKRANKKSKFDEENQKEKSEKEKLVLEEESIQYLPKSKPALLKTEGKSTESVLKGPEWSKYQKTCSLPMKKESVGELATESIEFEDNRQLEER